MEYLRQNANIFMTDFFQAEAFHVYVKEWEANSFIDLFLARKNESVLMVYMCLSLHMCLCVCDTYL